MSRSMIFARPPALSLPPVPVTLVVAAAMLWRAVPLAVESIGPVAGLAALAMAVHHLLTRLDAPQPDRAAALLLLLPSVLLNAGLPGPSDALWAVPCLIALAALVERRHDAMLGWFGLALGLSAQALLIAPFFRPGFDLQMAGYPALSSDAPNIWAILQALPLGLPLIGLALAAAIGATAAYTARFSAQILDKRALLSAALLAPLVMAGLLPGMSERCFLLADILALAVALSYRDKTSWTTAILVQAGSTLAVLGTLSGVAGLAMLGGVATIVATLRVARSLLNRAANDNPLMVRTV
jgi:hypothetical protein